MSTRNQRKYALNHGAAIDRIDTLESVLNRLQDLHKPQWNNCINACCSGEQCKHRSQVCEHDYDEWPCDTAKLIYNPT